jgi:hypothetical protein
MLGVAMGWSPGANSRGVLTHDQDCIRQLFSVACPWSDGEMPWADRVILASPMKWAGLLAKLGLCHMERGKMNGAGINHAVQYSAVQQEIDEPAHH